MSRRIDLLPAERFEAPPPVTFPPAFRDRLASERCDMPSTSVIVISRAQINHEGIVFRRLPLDVSFARPLDRDRLGSVPRRLRFTIKNYLLRLPRHVGPTLWFIDNLSPDNWYHWLTEVLPRLFLARRFFASVDAVALPEYYKRNPFVGQTLHLWPDLPPILWVPRSRRIVAHPLLLVERAAPPYFYRGSTLRQLAEYLTDRSRSQSQPSSSPDRLYVTRSDAAYRRVANEDAVRNLLHAEGFTTISCSKLSVVEQIDLFSRATVVVGAHGAGLVNMMFCQPGSAVIEFATADSHHHWRCYRNLAHALDLRYSLVCANTTAPRLAGFEERRDADVIVDLDNLHQAIARIT